MANTDAPRGFYPVRYKNGSPWNGALTRYWAPASYAVNLFIGDPVVIVGDSNDNEVQGQPPGSMSEVNLGAAGDGVAITGFIVGFDGPNMTREHALYGAASTDRIVLVADDPNIVFVGQDDGTGTLTADTVGLNANLVSGSGNTATGMSGWEIDGGGTDGPDADASNQLIILRLFPAMDNELADFARWEVLINQHTYGGGSGLGIA